MLAVTRRMLILLPLRIEYFNVIKMTIPSDIRSVGQPTQDRHSQLLNSVQLIELTVHLHERIMFPMPMRHGQFTVLVVPILSGRLNILL